ncbi:succinate-semialdehyde dehydrogenase / glutarate-semialdehyde dehydrogenase [Quadrisphaera granulorum]|uniref:Succinate-semialdehyde dehydrogenase/glutarate-semialdehyde dehydrogenase n=1 Tax=Quadrisphaera granulorum TaxID=317664 RepID=A0A316A7X6_9ACTN|nr:aldehyde dehydrogenase family protein [Quadrisphaera granulorum]PWJ53815.1 succinate-semialdehyde dehydrogenase/glutarate-semialdehyde dehydrogenase [Quadrisphaera granulorum]SZE96572.1 succinate-semialdehyde dehydrogenase / glutarate-semialdehyde dehydrogenase [Quadrisphaera granulorum]
MSTSTTSLLATGCWLDGEPVEAAGRSLPLVDPATGEPSGEVRCATPDQVEAALAGARAARRGWRTTTPGARAAALRAAAASVRENADALGDLLVATTGRLVGQARGSAVVAAELLEEAATTAVLDAGRSLAGSSGAIDVVRREPRGTVAVITPWNDPFPAAAGLLAAALVAGNTVVHKPSERSSAPGAAMAALIAAALPPGVLQVVTGDGEVGEALVADDRVDVVAQVGSTATGRRIGAVTGARGAIALLENGGKDPLLVDAGVDPAWAAAQIAAGAFTNTGQLCTSVERVYLHADVADAVLDELVELARGVVVADPTDTTSELGPLVDERQLALVSSHVEGALAAGAKALAGGERLDRPGSWYPPTVLVGCTDDMDVMTEETFGPVAAVRVVESWEEGLCLAGSGAYGLAATVLTPDTAHALQAADELEVGTVKVNAVWGGAPGGSADPRRSSGRGRGYGPDLIGELTALKAVHLEPAPAVRGRA